MHEQNTSKVQLIICKIMIYLNPVIYTCFLAVKLKCYKNMIMHENKIKNYKVHE